MVTTITVPDPLVIRLEQHALAQHRSLESVALDLLTTALDTMSLLPSVADVVNRIQAVAPNPQNIRVASGSLADALRSAASAEDTFDRDQWERQWRDVENEIRGMNVQDTSL